MATSGDREVAVMEICILNRKPSLLPAASTASPAVSVVPTPAPQARLLAGGWPLTRVHQVQAQVELAGVLASAGGYGVAGFAGVDAMTSTKRVDVRGVPPRGKPV